ncbi:UvrD-helicase domain-containing protein [Pelosinus sp. sgz500959]|uniref:UvrD-helicase domain-containing protein n=1 Tax=Pelosinus sp. sgz500959 TaxID=3242472 RepID=UPI00366D79CC
MKHLILQQFWDSIPHEKVQHVRRKLPYYLKKLTEERGNISNMPKGFYARRIRGTVDKYKFRMANDDRILFIYADDVKGIRLENKCGIVLLAYCNHDEQIRKGRNFEVTGNEKFSEYDFEMEGYTEETESIIFSEIEANYAALNLMIDHTRAYQVEDHDLARMAEDGVKDWQYYLNNEQYNCVQIHDRPVFLSGGAGTGKSTIGLHKLFALSKNKDAKLAYFTYTKTLKTDFEKMYDVYQTDYSKSNPNELMAKVEFHSLNDFCFTKLGVKFGKLIDFRKFESDFSTENWPLFHNMLIHKVDIWQEIRGLIKGFMGRYWLRNEVFDNLNKKISLGTLDFLIHHKFIAQIEKDHYMVIKNPQSLFNENNEDMIVDLLLGAEQGREGIITDIRQIKKKMQEGQFRSPLISKELYLSLEDDDCIFSKEERNQIYYIAEKYQAWLEKVNKFDENDLARRMLVMIKEGKIKPNYDYVMVDEVQDLSELQIYLLLSLKRDNGHFNDFFFSGDIHQMINPTYFSFSRLRMPFHYHHVEKELQLLEKNYRSQAHIVTLSNKMGELCKSYIGAKDNFSSIPLQNPGNLPFWLMPTADNERELFSTLQRKDRKYAIIVVPNETEKKRIQEEMGTAERVFTVQEIKGLEYDYVVCVNMLTPFLSEWQDIMAGQGKKNAKYRYYFNIFYVALTRAKRNLCIYEEQIDHPLLSQLRDYFQIIKTFDSASMELTRSANRQEILNDARNQERLGNYEQAMQGYADMNEQIGVLRCEGKIFREQGLYLEAIKKFLAADENDEAWQLAEELEDDQVRLFVLLQIMTSPTEVETMFVKPLAVIHEVIAQSVDNHDFMKLVYDNYLGPKFHEYQKKCDDCLHGIEMVKKEFASDE